MKTQNAKMEIPYGSPQAGKAWGFCLGNWHTVDKELIFGCCKIHQIKWCGIGFTFVAETGKSPNLHPQFQTNSFPSSSS
jgi:hypothetical protein